MTNCFSTDAPISFCLRLDVVVPVGVWECAGSSFPLDVLWLQACEPLMENQVDVSSVLVLPHH